MLKTRIIPTLLWDHFGLVKGVAFHSWRRVGIPMPAIQVYNRREVDELIFLDIRANTTYDEPDYATIMDLSSVCFVPFTVGGGIRTLEHIKKCLRAGADKISLNTICYEDPHFVKQACEYFGSQCIVVSIDAKKNAKGDYECFSHSGTVKQNVDPFKWAKKMEEFGAGEILITSMDRDGTLEGYDLELIQGVTKITEVPVIASGGAGTPLHMLEGLLEGKAQALAAASMFHFTQQTPKEVKDYLREHDIPVREQ